MVDRLTPTPCPARHYPTLAERSCVTPSKASLASLLVLENGLIHSETYLSLNAPFNSPLWDAYTLGWRDRRRLVDEAMLPWIYDAAGNAVSVVIDEGRIIGLWQFRDSDRLTFEFHVFEPYRDRIAAVEKAAEEHAEVLAELSSARSTQILSATSHRLLPKEVRRIPMAWKIPLYRNPKEEETISPMERRHTNTYVRKYPRWKIW